MLLLLKVRKTYNGHKVHPKQTKIIEHTFSYRTDKKKHTHKIERKQNNKNTTRCRRSLYVYMCTFVYIIY